MTHRLLVGSVSIFLAVFCAADVALAARNAFVPGSNFCLPTYKKWQKRERHWKAFAINKWSSGGQVCGWAGGHRSKQGAISGALKECMKYSKRSPGFGLKNSCYIYDVK